MTIDDVVIKRIKKGWLSIKGLYELGLITDCQYQKIKDILMSSTKKAERRYDA